METSSHETEIQGLLAELQSEDFTRRYYAVCGLTESSVYDDRVIAELASMAAHDWVPILRTGAAEKRALLKRHIRTSIHPPIRERLVNYAAIAILVLAVIGVIALLLLNQDFRNFVGAAIFILVAILFVAGIQKFCISAVNGMLGR